MKSLITSSLLLLASFSTLAGATEASQAATPAVSATPNNAATPEDVIYNSNADNTAQNPLQMESMAPTESPRHRQEKAHLMKRMSRKHGTWNTAHPRYRLLEAMYGFTKYRERNMAELNRWRSMYSNVGKAQKKTLEKAVNYKKKLDDIEEAFYQNEVLCKKIVAHAMLFYGIEQKELDAHIAEAEKGNRLADRISTSQTLKHFVRDWADEGSNERNDAFPCILSNLASLQSRTASTAPLKILLPGSGLGRLGTEIANLGAFEVTLNEWSMYMNLGYRFLTSPSVSPSAQSTFHPFTDALSHHKSTTDLLRTINFPNTALNSTVLLVEGDFTTAFPHDAHYDVLTTHFFIDTARNLLSYFATIHRLLKPGGRWVNFGPLLYGTGPWVQLSLDEIVAVIEGMGFVFEELGEECGALTFPGEEGGMGMVRGKEAEYGFNGRALSRSRYVAQVWVVRKL